MKNPCDIRAHGAKIMTKQVQIKNLDLAIISLVRDIYKNPYVAQVRETISNAYDANIQAKSKRPIEVTYDHNTIVIRDYGYGMSPEDFDTVYSTLFSSGNEKCNHSGEYSGQFGIGAGSPYGYLLQLIEEEDIHTGFTTVNIHKGIRHVHYHYIENNKLCYDKRSSAPTEQPDGFTVILPSFDDYNTQYWKRHVPSDALTNFTKARVSDFFNPAIEYIHNCPRTTLRVGTVVYEIDSLLSKSLPMSIDWSSLGLPMSELRINHSRDNIELSDTAIKRIEEFITKHKDNSLNGAVIDKEREIYTKYRKRDSSITHEQQMAEYTELYNEYVSFVRSLVRNETDKKIQTKVIRANDLPFHYSDIIDKKPLCVGSIYFRYSSKQFTVTNSEFRGETVSLPHPNLLTVVVSNSTSITDDLKQRVEKYLKGTEFEHYSIVKCDREQRDDLLSEDSLNTFITLSKIPKLKKSTTKQQSDKKTLLHKLSTRSSNDYPDILHDLTVEKLVSGYKHAYGTVRRKYVFDKDGHMFEFNISESGIVEMIVDGSKHHINPMAFKRLVFSTHRTPQYVVSNFKRELQQGTIKDVGEHFQNIVDEYRFYDKIESMELVDLNQLLFSRFTTHISYTKYHRYDTTLTDYILDVIDTHPLLKQLSKLIPTNHGTDYTESVILFVELLIQKLDSSKDIKIINLLRETFYTGEQ